MHEATILFPFGVRLSTWIVLGVFVFLGVRRRDRRYFFAALVWLASFEAAYDVSMWVMHPQHWYLNVFFFGASVLTVTYFGRSIPRPNLWIGAVVVALWAVWIATGFHVNDHQMIDFDPAAEAVNEAAKTLWAAVDVGVLATRNGRIYVGVFRAVTDRLKRGRAAARCARSIASRQRTPSTASLASRSNVARPPAPIRCARTGSSRRETIAAASDSAVRSTSMRVPSVDEHLARRRRVGCDERRPDGERLERLVWDHSVRLAARAEDAESTARLRVKIWNVLILDPGDVLHVRGPRIKEVRHLSGADDPKCDVRQPPCRLQDQLEAVQWRRLADEEDVKVLALTPGRPEEALLSAEITDRHLVDPCQLAHEVGVRSGVCDDQVCGPESRAVETA